MASRCMTWRKRLRRDERGVILVMAVPGLVLAVLALALSVDIGRQVFEKRDDQSVADMAALDAARAVSKLPTTAGAPARATAAQNAATASAARNGFVSAPATPVVATVGSVDPVDNQFKAVGFTAVQVTVTSTLDYIFTPGTKTVTARAVANVGSAEAEFSVGSTLASLDLQKSRLDPILGGMLGVSSPSLSLVSYQGLANANVTLGALQTQLLALGLDVGTTDKLMNTDIKVSDLLKASGTALTQQGDTAGAAEVNDIPIASIPAAKTVKLGTLINLSQPGSDSALDTSVNIFRLLTGSAQLANGTSFIDIPLTGISLPGLANVTMQLKVIQPGQTAKGPVSPLTTASNSQVTLRVTADVALGFLLPVAAVTLDYSSANAVATLTEIRCASAAPVVAPGITLTAGTSGINIVGTAAVPLGTLNITGSAAGTATSTLPFFTYDTTTGTFAAPNPQHVGAATLGLNLATLDVTGTGPVLGTLAGTLEGILNLPVVGTLALLNTALSPVIQPLLASLGANVVAADVQAIDIDPTPPACGGGPPHLVQ